jgi:hypothetical protein
MSDDHDKAVERRGYAKGYFAARKRGDRDDLAAEIRGRRDAFRQEVFLAILPTLVSQGTWGVKDPVTGEHKPWTTTEQFVSGAWRFADKAAEGTTFS